jgi:hypothetical protein
MVFFNYRSAKLHKRRVWIFFPSNSIMTLGAEKQESMSFSVASKYELDGFDHGLLLIIIIYFTFVDPYGITKSKWIWKSLHFRANKE